MSLEKRLAGGFFWMLLGTAASRGAVFVASILLARLLGRITFGEFGAIDSTIAMFAVFSNLGLAVTTTKFLAKFRHADPDRAGRILTLSCLFALAAGAVASLGLVTFADWLAVHPLGAPRLAVDFRIAAVVLIFSALNGTLSGALTGLHAFSATARNNIVLGTITVPVLLGGAWIAGLHGAVAGLAVTQLVNCCLQATTLRRMLAVDGIHWAWSKCWEERTVLLNVSVPALVTSSLTAPVNWACLLLLVNYGGGYAQLGLLQIVNTWFLLLLFLPGQLGLVYFPMFESLLAEGRSADVVRLMRKLVGANLLVFGAAAAGVTLLADVILRCYGPHYADARPALIVTVWTAVVVAVQQPLSTLVIAKSRMWQVTKCSLLSAVINVSLSFGLVTFGALGITLARLAAYSSYAALIGFLVLRPASTAAARANFVTRRPQAAA